LKVEYRKRFLKELAKIPSQTRKEIESFVFEEFLKYDTIFESKKIFFGDILACYIFWGVLYSPENP